MKYRFLKATFTGLVLLVVTEASAGLITDTDNNSYIDVTTGLEWMDFGINDSHSYTQVEALLDSVYEGWDLASQTQVNIMWNNAFSGVGSEADDEDSTVSTYTNKDVTINGFSELFDSMDYSQPEGVSSYGLYDGDEGVLRFVSFHDHSSGSYLQKAQSQRAVNVEYWRSDSNVMFSTMLVRSYEVPSPPTLAIFALGMIGLASRRFKKHS